MADNVLLNAPSSTGATIATDDISSIHHQLMKLEFGSDGVATMVDAANPLPAADAAVLAELVLILNKLSADPATQTTLQSILTKLNASIAVTGTFFQATQPVSGTVTVDTSLLSTSANQATGNTALSDILAELRDDTFTTSFLWEDVSPNPHIFYREDRVRDQNTGTVTTIYTRLSDNVVVGSLPATAVPVAGNSDRMVEFYRYIAIAGGTGYSAGDWITNTLIFDSSGTGAVIANSWYNLTTAAAIATPAFANLRDPEYDNNLEATQLLVKGVLDNIKTDVDKIPSQGQAAMAASTPVVIASNQSAIPISGTVTVDTSLLSTAAKQDTLLAELQLKADLTETQPVSAASLPLPAGASTAANQATEIASLASIDAGIPAALGQTTMAASMPVAIASNQSAIPVSGTVTVDTSLLSTAAKQDLLLAELQLKADLTETQPVSAASLPLPSGAATSAKQDTLLTELQLKADLTETQPVLDTNSAAIKTAVETIDNFISGARGLVTEDNSAAILAKIIAAPATEAKQDTLITSLQLLDDAIKTDGGIFAVLSDKISMAGGMVNDTPQSYNDAEAHPLSLTPQGRLRVSSVQSDNLFIWQNTFNNPWGDDNIYKTGNNYF